VSDRILRGCIICQVREKTAMLKMVKKAYVAAEIFEIPSTEAGIIAIRNGECGGMVDSSQGAMYQTIQEGTLPRDPAHSRE
jgi:hypothetical protein